MAYEPLWTSQVDINDGHVFLGFRDLQEVRVAKAFVAHGLSAQTVRPAIALAREMLGRDHPLSTNRFKTDGPPFLFELPAHRASRIRALPL